MSEHADHVDAWLVFLHHIMSGLQITISQTFFNDTGQVAAFYNDAVGDLRENIFHSHPRVDVQISIPGEVRLSVRGVPTATDSAKDHDH